MLSLASVPTHNQKLTDFAISRTTASKPTFFFTNEKGEVFHGKRSDITESESIFPKQS